MFYRLNNNKVEGKKKKNLFVSIPTGIFRGCRVFRVYLCVGLPSTSRPFPHLLGTPTGEPLHFLFFYFFIFFGYFELVYPPLCNIQVLHVWQAKKNENKINELLLAGNATCLVVHATLILKGNNKKRRRRLFLS